MNRQGLIRSFIMLYLLIPVFFFQNNGVIQTTVVNFYIATYTLSHGISRYVCDFSIIHFFWKSIFSGGVLIFLNSIT